MEEDADVGSCFKDWHYCKTGETLHRLHTSLLFHLALIVSNGTAFLLVRGGSRSPSIT